MVVGGENINIMATDLKTDDGSIRLSATENVNILSGLEEKSEQHIRESTGLKLKLDGSKLTYAQTIKDSTNNTETTNKSSNIETDNLIIESGQDTNVIASNIDADSMNVNAQRDFNVLSDRDVSSSDKKHSKKELGFELTLNKEEASLFAGYWENEDGKKSRESQVVSSNINVGNLLVNSENTNVVGSNIAGENININSQNIRILSDSTNSNTDAYTKSIKAGVEVGVKQNLSNAIDAIDSIGDAQSGSAVVARGLRAYDALQSFATKPVTAGVNAIYEEERTDTHNTNTQAVASSIIATDTLTLNATDELEIAGSDVASANALTINANNINIHASESRYTTESSSQTKNATVGLYGTNLGEATVGFQNSDLSTTGTRQRNSQLYSGGTASITSTEDTTLAGANIQARNLELNVGGNLNMQSLQETQTIDGSSRGGSISGNVMAPLPKGVSANVGETSGERAWVSQTTGINASERMRVNVGDTTTLRGASITNLNEDAQEQNNLEVNTQHLVVNDIKDIDTYDATTAGISIGENNNAPSLSSVEYTNNTKDKEQITRATIGSGNINAGSTTGTINRDTTNIQEITRDESSNLELYGSNHTVALLENPEDAISDLSDRLGDVGLASHVEILENLPSATKEGEGEGDFIDSTVGALLDAVGTVGILPSVANDGGYITQISTQLFGDNRNVLVVKDRQTLIDGGISETDIQTITKEDPITGEMLTVYVTNPDKAVRIDEQRDENDPLRDDKIYVSSEDIQAMGLDHLFTNGMFNDTDTAIVNQQTQQGYADGVLNYNQQHGILGDFIEDAQDHLSVNGLDIVREVVTLGQAEGSVDGIGFLGTGGSRQTGDVINQMTTITDGDLTVGAHSQGTMMTQNGLDQHQEELANIVQSNINSQFLVQYSGAPVNHNIAEEMVTSIYGGQSNIDIRFRNREGVSNVFRSHVAPQDAVGSFLGFQSAGINNSEQLGSNIWNSLISAPMLFGAGGDSSHSYYPCVMGCGDESFTPTNDFYYNPNADDGTNQSPLTDDYSNRLPHVNQGLLPQSTPQTQLSTTGAK